VSATTSAVSAAGGILELARKYGGMSLIILFLFSALTWERVVLWQETRATLTRLETGQIATSTALVGAIQRQSTMAENVASNTTVARDTAMLLADITRLQAELMRIQAEQRLTEVLLLDRVTRIEQQLAVLKRGP